MAAKAITILYVQSGELVQVERRVQLGHCAEVWKNGQNVLTLPVIWNQTQSGIITKGPGEFLVSRRLKQMFMYHQQWYPARACMPEFRQMFLIGSKSNEHTRVLCLGEALRNSIPWICWSFRVVTHNGSGTPHLAVLMGGGLNILTP